MTDKKNLSASNEIALAQDRLVSTLRFKGIANLKVLDAIKNTPRHRFIDPSYQHLAYEDSALPIGCGQTISQPFVVALMTEALLKAGPLSKVLEVGTGSGYQAAVLSRVAEEVYTIERIKTLYDEVVPRLATLKNVHLRFGDGNLGWPEHSPYDGIIVTAAASEVPSALKEQLTDGGRLVIPVGGPGGQQLLLLTRKGNTYHTEYLDYVMFVPLLGDTE